MENENENENEQKSEQQQMLGVNGAGRILFRWNFEEFVKP